MQLIYFFIIIWICLYSSCVESDENKIKCEIAAFLENTDGSKPMLIDSGSVMLGTYAESCEKSVNYCVRMVEEQAINGTNGGNFTLQVDDMNGYTVGDMLCDKADAVEENVKNKIVHIYWRLCGSSWKPTSFKMPELLCCEDGLHVPCRTFKSEL